MDQKVETTRPGLTKEQLARPLRLRHVDQIIGAMAPVIMGHLQVLRDRIAALEMQLASRGSLKYCGVHDPARQYGEGDFVTCHGSLWHCNRPTRSAPGAGSDDWQLAVKRGRDGRDAPK